MLEINRFEINRFYWCDEQYKCCQSVKRGRSLRYLEESGTIQVEQDTVFACTDIVLFQCDSQVIYGPFYDVFWLQVIKQTQMQPCAV